MRRLKPRTNIHNLKPYEPGKPIKELERELGIKEKDIIKLASNENPLGPSPKAVRAMLKAVYDTHLYPDGSCFYLKKKLASRLKIKPKNIVIGNGSDELIDIVTKTFLEEYEKVIISDPSFLEYNIITNTRGAKVKIVDMKGPALIKKGGYLKGFKFDLEGILKSIDAKTRLIFLGNPDNPTGAYLNKREFSYFLNKCPKEVVVVVDEAYREFVNKADYPNTLNYLSRGNLIILRTFSKAYGLAGLRVGYAVTSENIADWMNRARQPFNVNSVAQVAAEAALDDKAHLARTKKLVWKGKRFLLDSLRRLGCEIIDTPANFLLFSCRGFKGTDIFKRLLTRGIIIRDMKPYGLTDWVRVNVGTMRQNKRFIEVLKKVKE